MDCAPQRSRFSDLPQDVKGKTTLAVEHGRQSGTGTKRFELRDIQMHAEPAIFMLFGPGHGGCACRSIRKNGRRVDQTARNQSKTLLIHAPGQTQVVGIYPKSHEFVRNSSARSSLKNFLA